MPPESSLAPSHETSRGILLLEEYDALAIAIASALKKFAPQHGVRLARTLGEAEAAAAEMRPELFVLDLDPPPGGEVDFFNKLHDRFPEARVLVIAAGTSPELRAERGTAGAVQFIEKPFDLDQFGAAVQALLGPWATQNVGEERGTLRDLNVVDIVQLECVALSSAVVRLEAVDGRIGEIHFHHGEICHATTGDLRGALALEEIINWRGGKMSETELPPDAPKTIDLPWSILLLRAVRRTTENGSSQAHHPPPAPILPLPNESRGKTILVIDDTEMLLVFAADVLSVADETFYIVTALTGREGLALASTLRPDLIVLDYSLTDIDGAEVCRELLGDPTTARIPVLLMSGHLPELATTAADCRNVVMTLAKPFLSGALIDAVEKMLAAGPLPPEPTAVPPLQTQPPVVETPASPASMSAQPNGHGTEAAVLQATPVPSFSSSLETPTSPASSPNESQEETVTFSLEVLSMTLTPDFRLDSLHLKPAATAVGVRVAENGKVGMLVEAGFELGPAQLGPDGKIATLLLVPTLQPPQIFIGGSSLVVGAVRANSSAEKRTIEISATQAEPMRVQLTANFTLARLEFSPTFEITAVVLRAAGGIVRVGAGHDETALFELEQVQLDQAGRLQEMFVRAKR
ncbi:MAG: response regulator [Chthoniobacterales bacterium]|nr:response regulator [Chthoniobacterales bacterium]